MSTENAKTLQAYKVNIEESIAHSTSFQSSSAIIKWLDMSLNGLGTDAQILEIGSGVGRDAAYVKSRGYDVQCSDAITDFVYYMRERGHKAIQLDILIDDIARPYDLIFANAVLLHCTRDEMKLALAKIFRALRPNGRFSLTLKAGEGEVWSTRRMKSTPRYFCLWTEAAIHQLMTQIGFTKIYIEESLTPVHPDPWLHIRGFKD